MTLYTEGETEAQGGVGGGQLAGQSPHRHLATKANPKPGCFPTKEEQTKVQADSVGPALASSPNPTRAGQSPLDPGALSL